VPARDAADLARFRCRGLLLRLFLVAAGIGLVRFVAVAGRLPAAASVVRGVEPLALEVDGDRVQNASHRAFAALRTSLRRRLVDAVEKLEKMPVRALVLIDRHPPRG
jgi:hypothetical protein